MLPPFHVIFRIADSASICNLFEAPEYTENHNKYELLMPTTNEFEIHKQCERLIYKFLKVLEGEQAKTADFFSV